MFCIYSPIDTQRRISVADNEAASILNASQNKLQEVNNSRPWEIHLNLSLLNLWFFKQIDRKDIPVARGIKVLYVTCCKLISIRDGTIAPN